jgi:hypothetical protein
VAGVVTGPGAPLDHGGDAGKGPVVGVEVEVPGSDDDGGWIDAVLDARGVSAYEQRGELGRQVTRLLGWGDRAGRHRG